MNAGFILVAAGAGRRLGSSLPKAFVELAGKSLLRRSFEALQAEPRFTAGAVVVPADHRDEARRQLHSGLRSDLYLAVVPGGEERQDSVRAGLRALPTRCTVVVVHDAARALVTPRLIAASIDLAEEHGAVTAALPVTDTVKEVDRRGAVRITLDRSQLRLAQTPQAFRREVLQAAHELAERDGAPATDDAALVERCGGVVWTVEGDPSNVKITTPEDLAWARWWLSREPR